MGSSIFWFDFALELETQLFERETQTLVELGWKGPTLLENCREMMIDDLERQKSALKKKIAEVFHFSFLFSFLQNHSFEFSFF